MRRCHMHQSPEILAMENALAVAHWDYKMAMEMALTALAMAHHNILARVTVMAVMQMQTPR